MSNRPTYLIREERASDALAIAAITEAAFRDVQYSDHREHTIVENLRKSGQLILSLVAVSETEITGHVAFSPVTIDGKHHDWFGLGPLSVLPSSQGQGIGSALVQEGLNRLKQNGARGCCLIGDPAYYRRFGFMSDPKLSCDGVPTENVMALSFDQDDVSFGKVEFSQCFRTP